MGNEPVPPRTKVSVHRPVDPAQTNLDPTRLPGPVAWRGIDVPPSIDLGDVVAGSRRWFDVGRLIVNDGFRGQAAVLGYLVDEQFLAASSGATGRSGAMKSFMTDAVPARIVSSDALSPLRAVFSPTEPGTYRATLGYRADWSDQRVDQTAVTVAARAVPMDELHIASTEISGGDGHEDVAAKEKADTEQATKDGDRAHLDAKDQLGMAASEANNAAQAVGKARREGVANAEKEAKSFQQPTPEAAWWAELAEIAISMGTATIASILSRKITDLVVTRVLEKTVSSVKDQAAYYSVVDTVKEGVKASRKAAGWKPGKADKTPKNPEPGRGTRTFSSNRVIDFWANQAKATNDIGDDHAQLVVDTHAAMLALVVQQPATSVAVMRGLRDVFRAAKEQATIEQQIASESQWVAGVARGSLDDARKERTSSPLDLVLEDELYRRANGVVRVFATIDEDAASIEDARVTVDRAKVNGISEEIAKQLSTRPLAQFPMPVVVELAPGAYSLMGATIRREADGSMHVTGTLPYMSESDDPSRRAYVLAQIAQKVLGRPIRKNLLPGPELQSNDQSGISDP